MPDRTKLSPRLREIWSRLDLVCDPELDEPITEMGFVETVAVNRDEVSVHFRLPTYWCSPNFAFLMAEGIRREVGRLPWVGEVRVRLEDHVCGDELNAAVNEGRTFSEVFAAREDGGDLAEVRETFERKAYQRRQETVIRALHAQGFEPLGLAAMTLGELRHLRTKDEDERRHRDRYRELLVSRGLATAAGDHAFPDLEGRPLMPENFKERMRALRMVRINMEFGGALCRGLLQSRYQETVDVDGEPTLIDFIRGTVPPRQHQTA